MAINKDVLGHILGIGKSLLWLKQSEVGRNYWWSGKKAIGLRKLEGHLRPLNPYKDFDLEWNVTPLKGLEHRNDAIYSATF